MTDEDEPIDIDEEMFQQAMLALETAESTLSELGDEIQDVNTGLTHSDTVALLYGRSNSLNKGEIRDGFSTLEEVRSKDTRTLLKRLIADQSSELGVRQADAFLDELDRLKKRYGEQ